MSAIFPRGSAAKRPTVAAGPRSSTTGRGGRTDGRPSKDAGACVEQIGERSTAGACTRCKKGAGEVISCLVTARVTDTHFAYYRMQMAVALRRDPTPAAASGNLFGREPERKPVGNRPRIRSYRCVLWFKKYIESQCSRFFLRALLFFGKLIGGRSISREE